MELKLLSNFTLHPLPQKLVGKCWLRRTSCYSRPWPTGNDYEQAQTLDRTRTAACLWFPTLTVLTVRLEPG